jgi:branched-chain amino acid aminotransferase
VIVYLDGRYLPREEATVSIDDRGFLFADGVFETALLFDGGFFRLRQHLQRFIDSAAMLRLPPPDPVLLDGIARNLARENGLSAGSLRFTLTRGVRSPTLLVTIAPRDTAALERARAGWRLITARSRRPSPAAVPPQLKALGRTYALLARHEAADAAVDDALLLTDAGAICEGPTWNVFWRRGDTLCTPALHLGVLAGVTRTAIIDLARTAGLVVHEDVWARAALDEADEVFATMTSLGPVSISELDGRVFTAATRAVDVLRERYWQLVADEAAADPL